jgi:hypothetical protein
MRIKPMGLPAVRPLDQWLGCPRALACDLRVNDRFRLWIQPVDALIKQAHKLPRELYKSLTWDRGREMADHQRFSLATDVKVHFCDPQQTWHGRMNAHGRRSALALSLNASFVLPPSAAAFG